MRPIAPVPSPKSQLYVHLSRQGTPSSVVADASNLAACPLSGLAGITSKLGTGAVRFEGPVKLIARVRDTELPPLSPTGTTLKITSSPIVPGAGAVNEKVARPSLLVTTSLTDSVPAVAEA